MNLPQFSIGIALIGIALLFLFLYVQSFFWRKDSLIRRSIPYEPRNPVPWNGLEVFFFFVAWLLIIGVSVAVCKSMQFSSPIQEKALEPEQILELQKEHEIVQFIVCGRDDPRVFLIVFLAAVVIIPIGEEILFRLLLQGWLEKSDGSVLRYLRRFRGMFAVLCSSMVFAAIHLRSTTGERTSQEIFNVFLAMPVGYLVMIALIGAYLFFLRGATLRDLGIHWQKIPGDCLLGLGAACLLIPPIYFLNIGLAILCGDVGFALDPIPLFFFAVGLGVLFYRTRRILPCIVLHGIFNGISVALVYVNAYLFFEG